MVCLCFPSQVWWTERYWSRLNEVTECRVPRAAPSLFTRWWGSAGKRSQMRDPRSSTSSPFWKTTSQLQSHSTNQGTTSNLEDYGANSDSTSEKIKFGTSKSSPRLQTLCKATTQPHWHTCKCKEKMFSGVEVCPSCTWGTNIWKSVQIGALSSGKPASQNNPYGLATTLWSKQEGFLVIVSNVPADAVFYFFKWIVSLICSISPNFLFYYTKTTLWYWSQDILYTVQFGWNM